MQAKAFCFTALCLMYAFGSAVQAQELKRTDLMSKQPDAEEIIRALSPEKLTRSLCRIGVDPNCTAANATSGDLMSVALDIKFGFNSAALTPEAVATLDQLGLALRSAALGDYNFLVEGHTDAVGSEAYNQSLSERRAFAVRDYLARLHDVRQTRLFVVGKGESSPLIQEQPTDGRNRRVEIVNIGQ